MSEDYVPYGDPPMATYTFDLPPSNEQLQGIGMVAVEWSYLESVIDAEIWTLAGVPTESYGEVITAHLAMPARLNMLGALLDLENSVDRRGLSDSYIDRRNRAFGVIAKEIAALAAKRNAIVHSRWIRGEQGSPITYVVTARGQLKRHEQGMPFEELREIASQIAECSKSVRRFFQSGIPREDADFTETE